MITYTHVLNDLEAGKLPAWSAMTAPEVARTYWRLKVRLLPDSELTRRAINVGKTWWP